MRKQPNIAYVLEMVGGQMGILGLGYLAHGDLKSFLIRFLGLAIIDFLVIVSSILLSIILVGLLGFLLLPIINLVAAILSTSQLIDKTKKLK